MTGPQSSLRPPLIARSGPGIHLGRPRPTETLPKPSTLSAPQWLLLTFNFWAPTTSSQRCFSHHKQARVGVLQPSFPEGDPGEGLCPGESCMWEGASVPSQGDKAGVPCEPQAIRHCGDLGVSAFGVGGNGWESSGPLMLVPGVSARRNPNPGALAFLAWRSSLTPAANEIRCGNQELLLTLDLNLSPPDLGGM